VKARQLVQWVQERNPLRGAFLGGLRAHAERVLAQAGKWLGEDRRRLWGALAVVVAIGVGVAAIYSQAIGRYGRVIFASQGVAPLSEEVRRAAADRAKRLAAALDSRLDKKSKFGGEAWTSARMLVALREANPSYAGRVEARRMVAYFRSISGPECACWRKLPQSRYPNHLGITSWTLWTFAIYGIPAHKSEIEFLISTQNREGWWPLFAGASDPRFASTYGTAAAILALHEQSALKPIRAQRKRIADAVGRGASWLRGQAVAGRARWADYPAWPRTKERRELAGISGFSLYVLHRVGAPGLADLDRDWLANLPAEIPTARSGEASKKPVKIGGRVYSDDSPYHGLSWEIVATLVAYPNGSISGKAGAVKWLERALGPDGSIHTLKGTEGPIAAEALFALRNHPEIARNE
jgi:hypothetical protein